MGGGQWWAHAAGVPDLPCSPRQVRTIAVIFEREQTTMSGRQPCDDKLVKASYSNCNLNQCWTLTGRRGVLGLRARDGFKHYLTDCRPVVCWVLIGSTRPHSALHAPLMLVGEKSVAPGGPHRETLHHVPGATEARRRSSWPASTYEWVTPAARSCRVRSACSGSRGMPRPDRHPRRTHAAHREPPRPGRFFRAPPPIPALVAQRQRHGVQDAASVSSNLTEGTHHPGIRTRARAANGRRTGLRSRGLRVRVPPSARPARTPPRTGGAARGPEPYPDGREDVCKTSGQRFDSAPGLCPFGQLFARLDAEGSGRR